MQLTKNQTIEIKRAIVTAIEKVYRFDNSLINRLVHERSIAFRFGLYFFDTIAQTSFGTDEELTIDFDYNRNQYSVKDMIGFNQKHGVFPDIILHHRGFNDKNIVVIELKGQLTDKGRDDEKLIGFTHQLKNDYHYGLGVFIRLGNSLNDCEYTYYKNGAIDINIERESNINDNEM